LLLSLKVCLNKREVYDFCWEVAIFCFEANIYFSCLFNKTTMVFKK
jgi:hypothetical protein